MQPYLLVSTLQLTYLYVRGQFNEHFAIGLKATSFSHVNRIIQYHKSSQVCASAAVVAQIGVREPLQIWMAGQSLAVSSSHLRLMIANYSGKATAKYEEPRCKETLNLNLLTEHLSYPSGSMNSPEQEKVTHFRSAITLLSVVAQSAFLPTVEHAYKDLLRTVHFFMITEVSLSLKLIPQQDRIGDSYPILRVQVSLSLGNQLLLEHSKLEYSPILVCILRTWLP
jgi:hypothetical protein